MKKKIIELEESGNLDEEILIEYDRENEEDQWEDEEIEDYEEYIVVPDEEVEPTESKDTSAQVEVVTSRQVQDARLIPTENYNNYSEDQYKDTIDENIIIINNNKDSEGDEVD